MSLTFTCWPPASMSSRNLTAPSFWLCAWPSPRRCADELLSPDNALRGEIEPGQQILAQQIFEAAAALTDVRCDADEFSRAVFMLTLGCAYNDARDGAECERPGNPFDGVFALGAFGKLGDTDQYEVQLDGEVDERLKAALGHAIRQASTRHDFAILLREASSRGRSVLWGIGS
jgi:hypothetical protein